MIRINPNTGKTEVLYSGSQVNKYGPCKTAAHGPCFTYVLTKVPDNAWSANFWNGYNYEADGNFPAGPVMWAAGQTFSGCFFNKSIRPTTTRGLFGEPIPPGWWILERTAP